MDRPAPAVARVTLNRPERRNALSLALRDEVSAACEELAHDEAVKALVIAANGPVFSAGFDLREFTKADEDPAFQEALWASSDRFHQAVLTFPVPTIAAIAGPAIAGGFDLATCCDLRIATTAARFARPEFTWSDVLYALLHDLVGGAVARELTLAPCDLDAEQARAKGLVNRVVPPDELEETVLALAAGIATAPRPTLMNAKAKVLRRLRLETTATLDI